MKRFVWLTAIVVAGCASYPFSQSVRQQAQPLTAHQVAANPNVFLGQVVIWGGRILDISNVDDSGSLYLLKLPLAADGRPQRDEPSTGRFIARQNAFLDPADFRRGRFVTIAGTIAGAEREPIDHTTYNYPIVNINEIHFWQTPPPSWAYPYYYQGWWGPEWGADLYGPGWDDPAFIGPPMWVPSWEGYHGGRHDEGPHR